MTTSDELLSVFRDKLQQTGSLDAAFLKAVWMAYKKGIEDGKEIAAAGKEVGA